MTIPTDADVYGEAFALYREKIEEYDVFTNFLRERLRVNDIDQEVFKGKVCLDAGCGSGRGSIFMLSAGAKKVTGIDLSPKNVETSRAMARVKNFDNAEFLVGNVHELPFADEEFDLVWCNGVLHHTNDTDKGLVEISRVLKTDGYMWLYLYGSGGIEWAAVDQIREYFMQGVSYDVCLHFLRIIESHLGSISEFLDNWYTPHLKRYTHSDVQKRLAELGFPIAERLTKDVGDRKIDLTKTSVLGDQNLRYFTQKNQHPIPVLNAHTLPDVDSKGSDYPRSKEVDTVVHKCQAVYQRLLDYEKKKSRKEVFLRVSLARTINKVILDAIDDDSLDVAALDESTNTLLASLDGLQKE